MVCRGDRLVAREARGAAGQGDQPGAPTWVVPFALMYPFIYRGFQAACEAANRCTHGLGDYFMFIQQFCANGSLHELLGSFQRH